MQHTQGEQVDGKPQQAVWLDWQRLQQGPTLRYMLNGDAPEHGWGTALADLPASSCATPGSALE